MRNQASILILVLFLLTFTMVSGQTYHTKSSRALKAYIEAKEQYNFLYFQKAEKLLKEAISYDKQFYEAHLLMGEVMSGLKRYRESAASYRNAVKIDSLFSKPVFFSLANAEMMSGDYNNALRHFTIYISLKAGSEKNTALALKSIKNCEFAINAEKNPVPFNPKSVGDSVNTVNDEYWPSITADGQTLMFTRQDIIPGSGKKSHEDFYTSTLRNNYWSKAVNAGRPLNTPQNEGAQSISSDGTHMYFTACDKPGGMGRCDIYYSSFGGERWAEAKNIGAPVNTSYWESQPSVSSNGRMLFFTSNRPGGFGGMDIWFSVMGEDKKWKAPKNIGPLLNTPGDDMSPFIHFDGRTLYFSSNGQVGMGGYDIFFSRMNKDTTWTDPQNIGFPINTPNDELGLIIDAEGNNAYFSTSNGSTKGKDIYSFNLYESARPDPVSYFRGRVYDKESGKLLKADYELINLKTSAIVSSGSTDAAGSFLVCLPAGINYGLNVNKQGYLFYSDNFMLEGVHSSTMPFNKRILLNPVRVGETLQLTNVFYAFDSWEIMKESVAELKRLHRLLNENREIIVEVAGYTDSIGSASYNLALSERRAKAVVDWLTDKGIEEERLRFKGYGAASPIGDNITHEGRKLNRRTEVRIVGKK